MVTNTEVFLGSQAHLTMIPEVELYLPITSGSEGSDKTQLTLETDITDNIRLVDDLYVGCTIDRYTSGNVYQSSHTVTSNTHNTIDYTPAVTVGGNDYFIMRSYSAPCFGAKTGTTARLNADNWIGLVETASFPSVDVEMKQLNLQLGGSRNFSHQYKGIKTASGGNIAIAANHGAWLYYALGSCDQVTCTFLDQAPSSEFLAHNNSGNVYIDTGNAGGGSDSAVTGHVNTGPIFYRTAPDGVNDTNILLPPVLKGSDSAANLELLRRTTSTATALTYPITYRFKELDTADLPSFSLEQTLAKSDTLTTETGSASESHTFVRIARGNRVNSLTLTANENEEIKMTMDLNTAAVNKLGQTVSYEARSGVSANTDLFNYADSTAGADSELLEPFFFSKGAFTIFGSQFLKITNCTLTINNNIADKRYIGMNSKDLKFGIPAQRSYELSFTALVTDDRLFEELFTEELTGETGTTKADQIISLQFDKDNGEQILLKFRDYHLSASNITIPDDRGPITIEATVMPLSLHEDGATVKTHWVLQG